jgi:hypothetical protein
MFGSPWIEFVSSPAAVRLQFDCPKALSPSSLPSIITLVGRYQKSTILKHLTTTETALESHGQVHLFKETAETENPILFADCELPFYHVSQQKPPKLGGPDSYELVKWASNFDMRDVLSTSLVSQVLFPLSNIVCVFASDFNGIRGAARFIYNCLRVFKSHDLTRLFKPRLLVIAPVYSTLTSESGTQKLMNCLNELVAIDAIESQADVGFARSELESTLSLCFEHVQVVSVGRGNSKVRSCVIYQILKQTDQEVRRSRVLSRTQFKYSHLQAFSTSMVKHFCQFESASFSFVQCSRPFRFSAAELKHSVKALLDCIDSETCIWQVVIPLVSSALLLATYPNGSHRE